MQGHALLASWQVRGGMWMDGEEGEDAGRRRLHGYGTGMVHGLVSQAWCVVKGGVV